MLFLRAKVNHGHSLFGHRILSEQKKIKNQRGSFFQKPTVFFGELRTRITPKKNKNKKVKRETSR